MPGGSHDRDHRPKDKSDGKHKRSGNHATSKRSREDQTASREHQRAQERVDHSSRYTSTGRPTDKPHHTHSSSQISKKASPTKTTNLSLKRYQCQVANCCKSFTLKANLLRHERETHKGAEPTRFICGACSECFTRRASLDRHVESRNHWHFGGPVSAPVTSLTEYPPMPPEPILELLPPPPQSVPATTPRPTQGGKSVKLLRQIHAELPKEDSSTESEMEPETQSSFQTQGRTTTPSQVDHIEVTTTVKVFRSGVLHHQEQATRDFYM